jgi:hypothetical protein
MSFCRQMSGAALLGPAIVIPFVAFSGCAFLEPQVAAPQASVEQPVVKVGERWTVNERDGYNGLLKTTLVREVTAVAPVRVASRAPDGEESSVFSEPWNVVQATLPPHGEFTLSPPLIRFPFPLVPGKSWNQSVRTIHLASGKQTVWKLYGTVRGWEKVRVPAGEFVALKVVRDLYLGDHDWFRSETRRTEVDWYVPDINWIVKRASSEEYRDLRRSRDFFFDDSLIRGDRTIWELLSYRPDQG